MSRPQGIRLAVAAACALVGLVCGTASGATSNAAPRTVQSEAQCRGPRGEYVTSFAGAADGRARLEQRWPDGRRLLLGVDDAGAWAWDEWLGRAVPADASMLGYLRGHGFHALALWPEAHVGPRVSREALRSGGSRLWRDQYRTPSGHALWLERDARTGALLQVRWPDPGRPGSDGIVTRFESGEQGTRGTQIAQAHMQSGGDRWEFRYTSVVLDGADSSWTQRPGPLTDEAQLLSLHESALRAHRRGDVEELLAPEADTQLVVNRGRISRLDRAARRERFGGYFASTKFRHYADADTPVVRVSDDGTLGWVVARVHAEGTQQGADGKPAPVDVTWGWIELYEKRAGRWWRTGNVSNTAE